LVSESVSKLKEVTIDQLELIMYNESTMKGVSL